MDMISVNSGAVVVAAVVNVVIGMVWYSPYLFGRVWSRERNLATKEGKRVKISYVKGTIGALIAALVMAFVLAEFAVWMKAKTFSAGASLGFWAWLGFIVTSKFSSVLWDRLTMKMFFIHVSYKLVALVLMGGIVATWR